MQFQITVASNFAVSLCCCSSLRDDKSWEQPGVQDEATHISTLLPIHAYLTNMARSSSQSGWAGDGRQWLWPHEVNTYKEVSLSPAHKVLLSAQINHMAQLYCHTPAVWFPPNPAPFLSGVPSLSSPIPPTSKCLKHMESFSTKFTWKEMLFTIKTGWCRVSPSSMHHLPFGWNGPQQQVRTMAWFLHYISN